MSDSGPKTSEKIVSPYIPASLVRAATFRSIAGVPIIQGSSRAHPGLFNDRSVLGLKGTMSEAELHVLRTRLAGGI